MYEQDSGGIEGLEEQDLGGVEGLLEEEERDDVGAEEHEDGRCAEETLEDGGEVEGMGEGWGEEGEEVGVGVCSYDEGGVWGGEDCHFVCVYFAVVSVARKVAW